MHYVTLEALWREKALLQSPDCVKEEVVPN